MEIEIGELIGLIYDAALDASRWGAFLQRYSDILNFHVAQLELITSDSKYSVTGCIGLSAGDVAELSQTIPLNPWVPTLWRSQPGLVGASHEYISDADYAKSPYYQEFGRKIDQFYGQAGLIFKSESSLGLIGGVRSRPAGRCDERDKQLLTVLMPHLARALRMHMQFAQLNAQADCLLDFLDRLTRGVILFDEWGRTLRVNRAAERIIAQQDGLYLSTRGLRTSDRALTIELQRLIYEAAQTAGGAGFSSGGTLAVVRPSLKRPWIVVVSPYKSTSGDKLAAALLIDPDEHPVAATEVLAKTFGFTRAEARLSQLLASGNRVEDAAEQLGITVNTARTHVRRMLDKTGLRRQTELVLLLNKLPASS